MDRLQTQYQRLYLPSGARADDLGVEAMMGRDGAVRAMVLSLGSPADWAALSPVWRGVQADLGWPAPGIAVNGVDAFELWFSLAEAVAAPEAALFLSALCARYGGGIAPERLRCWPSTDAARAASPDLSRIPALQTATGRWSAFVSPDLPAVFGDDPSLDFQPGDDAQAELLSRLTSVAPSAWRAALAMMADNPLPALTQGVSGDGPQVAHAGPRAFLMAVMNDQTVALALRIDAAKALLAAEPLNRSDGG